jgi:hypothetical protein
MGRMSDQNEERRQELLEEVAGRLQGEAGVDAFIGYCSTGEDTCSVFVTEATRTELFNACVAIGYTLLQSLPTEDVQKVRQEIYDKLDILPSPIEGVTIY